MDDIAEKMAMGEGEEESKGETAMELSVDGETLTDPGEIYDYVVANPVKFGRGED